MKKWLIEEEERILTTPVFTVYDRLTKMPGDGKKGHFYVIDAPSWVNIIALTGEEQVILVQQYRHGTKELSWEIPGGAIDPNDETPLDAARRELAEETGFTSDKWDDLGKVSTNPAIFSNYCYFFLASHCKKTVQQQLDPFEDIKADEVPIKQFLKKVSNGEIGHSLVVAAAARLLLMKPHLTG